MSKEKMSIYDMRPDEVALRRKLRRQEVLGSLGAIAAWLLLMTMAYIACLAF